MMVGVKLGCIIMTCNIELHKKLHYKRSGLYFTRGQSGSVVECLTRERGATGSSLTGVTVLCP